MVAKLDSSATPGHGGHAPRTPTTMEIPHHAQSSPRTPQGQPKACVPSARGATAWIPLALLGLALTLGSTPTHAQVPRREGPSPVGGDPGGFVDPFGGKLDSLLAGHRTPNAEDAAQVENGVDLILTALREGRELPRERLLSLLDVAALGLPEVGGALGSMAEGGASGRKIRGVGRRLMTTLAEEPWAAPVVQRAAEDVLILPRQHEKGRRRAALTLVDRAHPESGSRALLTMARDRSDPLRSEALVRLTTWPSAAGDLFLVRNLSQKYDRRADLHPFTLLLERIHGVEEPLGEAAGTALAQWVVQSLLSPDWRKASRGLELSRGLPLSHRVPLLIDGLRSWNARIEKDLRGSVRLRNDIHSELKELSGRSIGAVPQRWTDWWVRVRRGEIPMERTASDPGGLNTSASFFGLSPVSDRITFVIDRSGSMEAGWGTSDHTRYEEAIEQMTRFLQAAGKKTWFKVILFSDEIIHSGDTLRPANPEMIAKARKAMLAQYPKGGTELRPAIHTAMGISSSGRLDLDKLECDTIIVLCDGETAEGSGWIQPFFAKHQAEARIKFHCVLIGTEGDGALEALAEGSDGEFRRIGG